MERIKIIIFEAGLPMIIVLLLEIFIKLPDYFNIALYIILFSITTALCDKKTNQEVQEKQDWKKASVCGITGVVAFVILLFLQKPLMKYIELQTTLQIIMSFLCSVCAVVILCAVLLRQKRKKYNYMDDN